MRTVRSGTLSSSVECALALARGSGGFDSTDERRRVQQGVELVLAHHSGGHGELRHAAPGRQALACQLGWNNALTTEDLTDAQESALLGAVAASPPGTARRPGGDHLHREHQPWLAGHRTPQA